MNETLIVIDIQNCFVNHSDPAYSCVIKNIIKEVKAAIQRQDYIIFVEYLITNTGISEKIIYRDKSNDQYPTLPELTTLVVGYDKVIYVFKRSTDGGSEVVQTLREKEIPHEVLRVCGAYTGACVSETVQTLSIKLKNSEIKLVKNALASYAGDYWGQENAINYMISMENVKLHYDKTYTL